MKILLAPSETKSKGGQGAFDLSSLLFGELTPQRTKILHLYTNVLQKNNIDELKQMFGLKKIEDISYYAQKDIIHEPAMKAIERYTGVAFDYLDYSTMAPKAQAYIDEHTIIFSNIFGLLRAGDPIPEYRLQQGKSIGDIKPERFYKPLLQPLMDDYLRGEDVLDIRAGFYDKYYKPSIPYTTLKFIKNGKVVSHWAKAYRGIVLREMASNSVDSLEEFMALPIDGLSISEIQTKQNKTEIVYNIDN